MQTAKSPPLREGLSTHVYSNQLECVMLYFTGLIKIYKSLFGERIGLQFIDFMSQMCKLILKLRVEIEIDFLKLLSVN